VKKRVERDGVQHDLRDALSATEVQMVKREKILSFHPWTGFSWICASPTAMKLEGRAPVGTEWYLTYDCSADYDLNEL
jgi:hypothetical protein